jgi:hypothetical protein
VLDLQATVVGHVLDRHGLLRRLRLSRYTGRTCPTTTTER